MARMLRLSLPVVFSVVGIAAASAAGQIVTPVTPGTPGAIVTPVKPQRSGAPVTPLVKPLAQSKTMWLAHDLRLRQWPGLNAKVLGSLKTNSSVTVVGEVPGKVNGYHWYQVDVDGKRGYIADIKLSDQQPPS